MSEVLGFFIKAVEDLLHSRGLSKSDLAKNLGVSPTSVNRYLGGQNTPGLDKAEELARALGVPAFYLLMSPEERKKWDSIGQTTAPHSHDGASKREKLIAEVLVASESTVDLLLRQLQKLRTTTPEERLRAAEELLSGSRTTAKKKAHR